MAKFQFDINAGLIQHRQMERVEETLPDSVIESGDWNGQGRRPRVRNFLTHLAQLGEFSLTTTFIFSQNVHPSQC